MPKFLVVDGEKQHDGKVYSPGDVIECDAATAATMRLSPVTEEKHEIEAPAAEPVQATGGGPDRIARGMRGKRHALLHTK